MIEIEPSKAPSGRTHSPPFIGLGVLIHTGPLSAAMFWLPNSRPWPAQLACRVAVAIDRCARRIAPVRLEESWIAEQATGLVLPEPGAYRCRARARMAACAE